ncbi:hypothetical protein [Listeria sp. ILCC797]|uniref:hypothetical protein n=1 Tax=Listeria sp. ILCC797 TaxID=1918333 RepID=UPI000B58C1ED|nr:hypothetical protein [Listeria sp. ILCC797]
MKKIDYEEALYQKHLQKNRMEWVNEDIERLGQLQLEIVNLAKAGWRGQAANEFCIELEETAEQEWGSLKQASKSLEEELENERAKLHIAQQKGNEDNGKD